MTSLNPFGYNYVPAVGDADASLAFIGEAPGKVEDELLEPFVGPAGEVLDRNLVELGLSRSEVWLTNINKYKLQDNDFKNCNVREAMPVLLEELNQVKPSCLVLLGDNVLKAFTGKEGITKYRGSILRTKFNQKAVATYHPAAMLYDGFKPYNELLFRTDIQKAMRESKTPAIPRLNQHITICKSPYQLFAWLRSEKRRPYACIDIEVISSIPVCVGISFGPYRAMVIPLFQSVLDFKLTDMTCEELAKCHRMLAKVLAETPSFGQNYKFDQEKMEALGFRFHSVLADTQLMAATLEPELPKSLEFNLSIHTDIPYYKDEGRKFNPKWDKMDDFFTYCGKDVCSEAALFEALNEELRKQNLYDFYYDFVQKAYPRYYKINTTGFALDYDKREKLRQKYQKQLQDAQTKLNKLVGRPFNVKSTPQIKELMKELRLPERKKWDEDVMVRLIVDGIAKDEKADILKLILLIRKLRDTISRYLISRPDFDGYMKTITKQAGTETGRTATGILQPPVRPVKIGISMHGMTKHGDVGNDMREMIVPRPGRCFVEVDGAQAEARVVALLSKDYELLERFDDPSFDMHIYTAEMVFDKRPITKKDDERQMGKKVRHAGNYAMGAYRLIDTVQSEAFRYGKIVLLPERRAEAMLDRFHKSNPNIRGVYHEGIKDCLYEDRTLICPNGRKRYFYGFMNDHTFKEAYAYIPQAVVSDQVKLAMIDIGESDWFDLLLESHDGVLYEVEIDRAYEFAREMKALFERPINFKDCSLSRDYDLVIPAECSISHTNWKELKEIELH